jgi:tetratricopeptide (TPR) repeat protein
MRLNPHYPDWYLWGLGVAYYDARRYEEAITTLESRKRPNLKSNLYLAAAYALQGRQEQAQATVQKILDENPESSIERYGRAQPYKNETDLSHYIDGLRSAGLPEQPPLKLPDKPSIAVLPFTNMSGDPEQDYFADGMTEDLTTDLSKISGLFVIARNSAFAYKGKNIDVKRVARELGRQVRARRQRAPRRR